MEALAADAAAARSDYEGEDEGEDVEDAQGERASDGAHGGEALDLEMDGSGGVDDDQSLDLSISAAAEAAGAMVLLTIAEGSFSSLAPPAAAAAASFPHGFAK